MPLSKHGGRDLASCCRARLSCPAGLVLPNTTDLPGTTHLPRMTRVAQHNSCGPARLRASPAMRCSQPIEAGGIIRYHLVPLLGGALGKLLDDDLLRLRPGAVGMGVVGGPKQVVHTDQMAHPQPEVVLFERRAHVGVPVVARRLGPIPAPL